MAILKIYEPPALILRQIAKPVEQINDSVRALLDDMLETMYDDKGIGLAAPQVGVSKRLITIDLQGNEGHEGPMYFINPKIVHHSQETMICMEGCLSLPEQFAEVERFSMVTVEYQDYDGAQKKIEASGLLSDCLQHEIDHLNGVLFVDYLSKMKRDRLLKKLKKSQKERGLI